MKERLATARTRLNLGFALLLAMLLLLAGTVAYESYRISTIHLERQEQTGDLLRTTVQLQTDLLNLETGKRGFLLNGQDEFLEPYRMGRQQFEEDLEKARRINGSNGKTLLEPEALDDLESQYESILAFFEEQIATRRSGTTDPDELRLGEGKAEVEQARAILDRLEDEALASRNAARDNTEDAIMRENATAMGIGALAFLLGVVSLIFVRRGLVEPLQKLKDEVISTTRRVQGESGDLESRSEALSAWEPDSRGSGGGASEIREVRDAFNVMIGQVRLQMERIRALVSAIDDPLVTVDLDGRITYFNPAASRLTSHDPEEAKGRELAGMISPPGGAELLIHRAMREGTTLRVEEETLCRKDGGEIPISSTASPLLGEDGSVTGGLKIMRDITERKQAETALQKSEARNRAVVDTATDAIITMTTDGLIHSFNPAAERIFGYTAEEVVGQPLRVLMPERFRGPHEHGFRRYLAGGGAHVVDKGPVELAGLRKSGEEFPLELSLGEMREKEDILFTGIIRDITERKQAEEKIQANERRFRQLFDRSADALLVHDSEGRVVDCNAEVQRSLGYTREEMLGLRIRDFATNLVSEEEKAARKDGTLWQRAMHGDASVSTVTHTGEHVRKDGTTFPVEVRVSPLDYDGERMIFASARDITERVRAEEALRESEERYRLVAQATKEAIWDTDLLADEQTWNGAVEQMFGYPSEQVTDTVWWEERVHPEDRGRVTSSMDTVFQSGSEAWTEEYRFQRADGTYATVADRAYVVRDDEGDPVRLIGSMMEVTERRQAEEELRQLNAELEERVWQRTERLEAAFNDLWRSEQSLRESEERYSLVVAGSNDGIWDWDIGMGELFCNDRLLEIVGLPRAETTIDFDLIAGRLHPEDHQRVMDALTAHLERDEDYDEEFRLLHSSGEYRTCIGRGKAARNEIGEPVHMAGTVTDITERKRAEEEIQQLNASLELRVEERTAELRESEERFRTLTDASLEAIIISESGAILEVNRAYNDTFGYEPDEIIGESVLIGVAPESRDLVRGNVSANYQEPYEAVGLRKSGERFDMETRGRSFKYRDRTVRVSTIRDITERKRHEEELEAAREVAEEASRAKSDFLANMSHEIRTPMNGIIGMTELMLDTDLDPEQREYAETVRRSGDNLLTIINDILDFSKIEAGKMRVETIDFDLLGAVEDTVSLLAERAHVKGLELASAVDPGSPLALRGDPGRIKQVLTNLLGNAIKFTEAGEVVLRVEAAEESAKRAVMRFEVRDTGIGMSVEQQERLFQSFTQADTSTTRKYGGTGLGLAISKQLVELMGGEIGLESEPSVGSTFYFELPLGKQADGTLSMQKPRGDLRGLRALVVDDNATNRQILDRQLSSWQIRTTSVENASQALEELRSATGEGTPYDLAVLDMMMPEVDGIDLARRIKADPSIAAVRLVLLTSAGTRDDAGKARRCGIEVYLTKPVRQSELYDALATLMGEPGDVGPEETSLITRHSIKESRAGGGARILLVEDNAVNQKVAAVMLERLGYQVEVAADGLEALEALSRARYSAVLMDVQMPNMDGYEATAEIRRREAANGEHPDLRTPIIAMTANAMQGDRERALAAGMDDYLSKPVKSEALDELLGRWISQPNRTSAPADTGDGPHADDETLPVLDLAALEGLRELQEEGEPDIVAELAEMFVEDASSRLDSLREAVAAGDASGVERAAHTLKGSSGNMGARRMQEISSELQDIGASGDLSEAAERLARLEEEFERVRPALAAFLEDNWQV